MTDEPVVLVCVPVASELQPIADSITVPCMQCRQPCWLAPTSFQVMHRATVLCSGCAYAITRAAQLRRVPMRFGGFLPGQLEELARDGARDDAARDDTARDKN